MTHPNSGDASVVAPTTPHPPLIDNHGRKITYLRLSITDRCNLRCRYCRPEKGVPFVAHDEILRFEELERLVSIFSSMGITKVRVTGGEPFSRKGCMGFLSRLKKIYGIRDLHITTNGVNTARYLDDLEDLGISGINLSLDTLDRKRFWQITRRDALDAVLETLHTILALNIPLKLNSVVLDDLDDGEIVRLADLARRFPVTVRFIEKMPFSGIKRSRRIDNGDLPERFRFIFPDLTELETSGPTTARLFSLPGYQGHIGLIQGHSRKFCNACNKLRITPVGMMKTCLYDKGALDLKKLLRSGAENREIREAVIRTVGFRFQDGHEAERFLRQNGSQVEPSMAGIGG